MLNFIGKLPPLAKVLAVPESHFHDYEKSARTGRKLGHATVTAPDYDQLEARLSQLEQLAESA
jgi:5-(carboxyamino)imidazole ribonucleotide synthase